MITIKENRVVDLIIVLNASSPRLFIIESYCILYHAVVVYVSYNVVLYDKIKEELDCGRLMDSKEFSHGRHLLGKTQDQLAQLLCVSLKAVQSFEQGWRRVPPYIERQLLLLLSLKRSVDSSTEPCWKIKNCPDEWRENCIVWELKARHFCWFMNGTFCQGQLQKNWDEKIRLCRECEVYKSMLSEI